MSSKHHLVVVAPKAYEDVSRTFIHEVQKDTSWRGELMRVGDFRKMERDNAVPRTAWVLFLGTVKENAAVKPYESIITLLHTEGGVYYGFNGNKAVCYGDGDLKKEKSFLQVAGTVAAYTGAAVFTTVALLAGPVGWTVLLGAAAWETMHESGKKKKLRKEQTCIALALFHADAFPTWTEATPPSLPTGVPAPSASATVTD